MRVPAIFPLLSCWPVPSRALLISIACTSHVFACTHARSADALQFLRSHALQPDHDDSMTVFSQHCLPGPRCAPDHPLSLFREPSLLCSYLHARACTRRRRTPFPALAFIIFRGLRFHLVQLGYALATFMATLVDYSTSTSATLETAGACRGHTGQFWTS